MFSNNPQVFLSRTIAWLVTTQLNPYLRRLIKTLNGTSHKACSLPASCQECLSLPPPPPLSQAGLLLTLATSGFDSVEGGIQFPAWGQGRGVGWARMLSSLPRDTGMGSSNSWFPVPQPETASSGCPGAGVLRLGTVCTSGQSCDTTPSTRRTVFCGLPGGLPVDASGTLSPGWDNQKSLQTLPSVPWGTKCPPIENAPIPR